MFDHYPSCPRILHCCGAAIWSLPRDPHLRLTASAANRPASSRYRHHCTTPPSRYCDLSQKTQVQQLVEALCRFSLPSSQVAGAPNPSNTTPSSPPRVTTTASSPCPHDRNRQSGMCFSICGMASCRKSMGCVAMANVVVRQTRFRGWLGSCGCPASRVDHLNLAILRDANLKAGV
ncbi:hypothetical protein BDV96DRAFT_375919 [Lophiotrema nucula]|uniref:Uncharacterized protein n=1 Tax=Lophiotrema nucula TaxID=690887 RepID=A0A6A5YGR4_9PLEO|nr:hypothetical protein BDV96DRAFT_375919 [Lophiotrema nucula]